MTKFLIITDDATLEDIDQAIANLHERQRRTVITSTKAELGDDIDELLDMRARLTG